MEGSAVAVVAMEDAEDSEEDVVVALVEVRDFI